MRKLSRSIPPLLAAVAIAGTATAQDAPPTAPEALSPLKILLTMSRTYAGCRSYRDTGKARTKSVMEGSTFGSEVPFSTAFVRDGKFRFEFIDSGLGDRQSVCIIAWDGAEVSSWWDAKPGVRSSDSLQQALDAATGISNGVSQRVPGMLLPAVVGSGPPLVDPERAEDDVLAGAACFRIKGKSQATPYIETSGTTSVTVRDEVVTLWIDRASHLLRKVEEVRTLDSYKSTRTTTYAPEMNVEIPADALAFNPPQPPLPAAPAPATPPPAKP